MYLKEFTKFRDDLEAAIKKITEEYNDNAEHKEKVLTVLKESLEKSDEIIRIKKEIREKLASERAVSAPKSRWYK